jgi:Ras-related protein Rab-7A
MASLQVPRIRSRRFGPDFKKPIINVIMLGDKGVGKTSLFGSNESVSGNVSHKNEYVGKMPVIVKIWDMNQRELRRMYNKVECCLLIYDMTKATSFHALKAARTEFLAEADLEDPDNFPFVVIGNKVDLHGERKIPGVMASNWCKSINAEFQETSTAGGYGNLVARVLSVMAERATRVDAPVYMKALKLLAEKKKTHCQVPRRPAKNAEGADSDEEYDEFGSLKFQPHTAGYAAVAIMEQAHIRSRSVEGSAGGVAAADDGAACLDAAAAADAGSHGRAVRRRRD